MVINLFNFEMSATWQNAQKGDGTLSLASLSFKIVCKRDKTCLRSSDGSFQHSFSISDNERANSYSEVMFRDSSRKVDYRCNYGSLV